jgi:hypothetical protein
VAFGFHLTSLNSSITMYKWGQYLCGRTAWRGGDEDLKPVREEQVSGLLFLFGFSFCFDKMRGLDRIWTLAR